MIVTSGEEPVLAMPIHSASDVKDGWMINAFGSSETLYRKTNTTNFVYSTTIDVHHFGEFFCAEWPCNATHTFKPHDLFGAKVEQIYFNLGDKYWRCPKHKKQESRK